MNRLKLYKRWSEQHAKDKQSFENDNERLLMCQ